MKLPYIKYIGLICFGVVLFATTSPVVYAQPVNNTPLLAADVPTVSNAAQAGGVKEITPPTKKDDATQALIDSANMLLYILKWCYIFLMPILAITGKFMSNDWVVGSILNLDAVIGVVWQYVRNIVNISMMLYLLYLAGANIVSVGSINFKKDIKAELPKVAMVLVAVNFSLLLCRTILGISGALTVAAFSLPNEIGSIMPEWSDAKTSPFVWEVGLGNKKIVDLNGKQIQGGTNVYYMECIHKNYAISMQSLQQTSDVGSMIIPNPVYDSTSGMYTTAWYHNYRRVINQEKFIEDKATGRQIINPEFKKALEQAKSDVIANAKAGDDALDTKVYEQMTDGTLEKTDKKDYPYYADCVTGWDDFFFSERNAMFVFAFNLMQIGEYENGLGNITSIGDLFTRGFISVVYLGLFFAISIALMLAVVIRGVMLWFLMAVSPIWVMVKLGGNFGVKELDKLGSIEAFLSLAFMPAVLGFILSMGFMMINYIKYIGKLENLDAGRFPLGALNIYFDPNNPLLGGISSLFDMMIAIITLVVLWMAVKTAFEFGFKKAESIPFLGAAYKNTVGKVIESTDKFGNFAATIPFKAPLIQTSKGKLSLKGAADFLDRKIDSKINNFDAESGKTLQALTDSTYRMSSDRLKNFEQKLASTGVSTSEKFKETFADLEPANMSDKELARHLFDNIVKAQGREFSFALPNGNGTTYKVDAATSTNLYNSYATHPNRTQLNQAHSRMMTNLFDPQITEQDWNTVGEILRGKRLSTETSFTYDVTANTVQTPAGARVTLSNFSMAVPDIKQKVTDEITRITRATAPNDKYNATRDTFLKEVFQKAGASTPDKQKELFLVIATTLNPALSESNKTKIGNYFIP